MIRIFFPGKNVPEWLEKVEVQEGGKRASLKFDLIRTAICE